jgi:hypothetical protein
MPTEIRRCSAPSIARSRTPRLSPTTIALTVAFVTFHLISGVLLERSHASPALAPTALAAFSEDSMCPQQTQASEQAQPYD